MKPYIKKFLYPFLLILFLAVAIYPSLSSRAVKDASLRHAHAVQPDIADKVLRFHVLANSDSAADQNVKLLVRGAIGAYLAPLLSDAGTKEAALALIGSHLDEITAVAEAVLVENGYTYGASASLCRTAFPDKTYGAYTFPSGSYDALEITLGSGGGHNWWCVLYPNMCFSGSVYQIADDASEAALKQVLSADEYEAVRKSGNYKIRLRFLEYFR